MLTKVGSRGSSVGQAISYSALSDFPRALPPSPESATLANRESAGKYYAETHSYRGSTGNEIQSQGIEPRTALLLANANTTKPLQRRNGLVVLAFANNRLVHRWAQAVLCLPGCNNLSRMGQRVTLHPLMLALPSSYTSLLAFLISPGSSKPM